MRTRTKGIILADNGERTINKEYKGKRIYVRLGVVSQEAAEAVLRQKQFDVDVELGKGTTRYWCDAAEAYLNDCVKRKVRTIELIAYHIGILLPYIGHIPLPGVHSATMEAFIEDRLFDEAKPATVNRSLEVVRTTLNKCARVWRDENDQPWLATAPLIEMLDESGARLPYPISWQQQHDLFKQLPAHLSKMALFAVNTGCRDENICGLEWAWERWLPELRRSVFVIPPEHYKMNRHHVVVLNDVAWDIVQEERGKHEKYVFTYFDERKRAPRNRVDTINNTGWQKARSRANLAQVRVHDLRHTYASRLRAAGVAKEDRDVLMGHASSSMGEHYATPTIARLIDLANLALQTRDTPTLLRVVNG